MLVYLRMGKRFKFGFNGV